VRTAVTALAQVDNRHGVLPGRHFEKLTIGSLVVEPEYDLLFGEQGLVTLGSRWKLGID
jgi:hypothetical protein